MNLFQCEILLFKYEENEYYGISFYNGKFVAVFVCVKNGSAKMTFVGKRFQETHHAGWTGRRTIHRISTTVREDSVHK